MDMNDMMNMIEIDEIDDANAVYPEVLVRVNKQLYAVNSKNVISMIDMQDVTSMPGTPKEIMGIMKFRGIAVPVINMRTLFNSVSIQKEFEEFKKMIDQRITDHINWVSKLEESVATGERFTLVTDPHQCAFGRWFYQFESNELTVKHHLNKIEEPHRLLHELALDIEFYKKKDTPEAKEKLEKLLDTVKTEYMSKVVELLEETKMLFESVYSEMMVVLEKDGRQASLVVDEILSVEELDEVEYGHSDGFKTSEYIKGIRLRKEPREFVLQLDDEKLLECSSSRSREKQ